MNDTERVFGQTTYIQNRMQMDENSNLNVIHRLFILIITLAVPCMFFLILVLVYKLYALRRKIIPFRISSRETLSQLDELTKSVETLSDDNLFV